MAVNLTIRRKKNMNDIIGFYFGIDCDPFQQRPDTYAMVVFDKIGLNYFEPKSKVFGAWSWKVNKEMTAMEWKELDSFMEKHFNELYDSGKIRGAVRGCYKSGTNLQLEMTVNDEYRISQFTLELFRYFFINPDISYSDDNTRCTAKLNGIDSEMMPDLQEWISSKLKEHNVDYVLKIY